METKKRVYGFGILGSGSIANFHARAIKNVDRARLVGVWGGIRAADFAKQYGIRYYNSLEGMLADGEIDVVNICTPSGLHFEEARAVLERGKNTIVEKPVCTTLPDALKLEEIVKRSGRLLSVCFQKRFADVNMKIRKLTEGDAFGRFIFANAFVKWYRKKEYYTESSWHGTWKLDGGGALMNQAIHHVDLLAWMVGEVEEVNAYAATRVHRMEAEDTFSANLKFKNGAFGVIQGATSTYPGVDGRLEIHGEKGTVIVEEDRVVFWDFIDKSITKPEKPKVVIGTGATDPTASLSVEGHRAAVSDFVAALDGEKKPLVDMAEGIRSIRLIDAIYRSAKERREVKVQG
jgi:predicted dehydrogenase